VRFLPIGGGLVLGAALLPGVRALGHALAVVKRGRARCDWPGGVEAMFGAAAGRIAGEPRRTGRLRPARAPELVGR
jgi:hypothetical protein